MRGEPDDRPRPYVNAVQRQVGGRVLEAGEARTVTIIRTYDAPCEDVWDACTNRERLPRWFLPVSGDLEVGGRYQLQDNAAGTVDRCDPPASFAATWEMGDLVSWIELRLSAEAADRTRLELEHIMLVDDGGHWEQFGPGATGVGWDLGLMGWRSTSRPEGVSMKCGTGVERLRRGQAIHDAEQ